VDIFLSDISSLTQTMNLILTLILTEQSRGKCPRGNCPPGGDCPFPDVLVILAGDVSSRLRDTVVERRSLTDELSLSHARPIADG